MILLAIFMIVFNCATCIYLFIRKRQINSPFQFFYLLLLGLAVYPAFFDLQTGAYEVHAYAAPIYLEPAVVLGVHTKLAVMLLTFVVLELALSKRGPHFITLPKFRSPITIYDGVVALIVATLIGGIYFLGFQLLANVTFGELRQGEVGTYSLLLFYLQTMVVGLPAVYWLKAKRKLSAAAVMALFSLSYLLLGGSRQTIILSLMAFLALAITHRGRWSYVVLIIISTVGFSAADVVLQAVKAIRNLPSMEQRLDFVVQLVSGQASLEGVTTEASLRFVMYGFLSEPLPSDFGQLAYFRRALLFWLPSAVDVLRLKPPDFEYTMFAEAMGNRQGTMHATFFGSVYADAGLFSFVWITWFAVGFRVLEGAMLKLGPLERAMVWSSCIYLSFMAARGSLYAPFVITGVVLLLAWLSSVSRRIFGAASPVAPWPPGPGVTLRPEPQGRVDAPKALGWDRR